MLRWPGHSVWGRWLRGLPLRIMLLLTLALLPLGFLAISQTRTLTESLDTQSRLSLVALTNGAVTGEERALQQAIGAADLLTSVANTFRNDVPRCAKVMQDFLRDHPTYSFAGFLETDGIFRCASVPGPLDFSDHPALPALMAAPILTIRPELNPQVSSGPVSIVFRPVWDANAQLQGFITLSVPLRELIAEPDQQLSVRPFALSIYNGEGMVLRARGDDPLAQLPPGTIVDGWPASGTEPAIVSATAPDGQKLRYVILPMIPDQVYAIATWDDASSIGAIAGFTLPPAIPPILMWLASLAVAYLAIHRLVVRHIQRLGRQMQRFGADRALPKVQNTAAIPDEIHELEATFQGMALDLIGEEARMEDALREKNLLLREVHHRVKNSLQLISSIMNMQMRSTDNSEARDMLGRLQDRVRGLATVYGYLYRSETIERTSAASLLSDVFDQALDPDSLPAGKVTLTRSYEDAMLTPDQAIPLALLANEVANNTLKSVVIAPHEAHQIHVSFKAEPSGRAHLRCANTLPGIETDAPKSGLGDRLIRAFSQQLGADTDVTVKDGWCTVDVHFTVLDVDFDDVDY